MYFNSCCWGADCGGLLAVRLCLALGYANLLATEVKLLNIEICVI